MGNSDYKRQILARLVDWYENSPAYVRGEAPPRRRKMRLYDGGRSDFPAYDIEDHMAREAINRAVLEMAEEGLVKYAWMRGQHGHILAEIWLDFGRIADVYAYLNRQPKSDTVDGLLLRLKGSFGEAKEKWVRLWLEDTLSRISKKRSIGKSLPQNEDEREALLKAISCLMERSEEEVLERVFSIQCFGDSKEFERLARPHLVRILRKYLVGENCTDGEALGRIGIVRYPEQFEFSGGLSMAMPGGSIDFSLLPFGGTLKFSDIKCGIVTLDPGIRRVTSIENRANYIDYIHKTQEKDEFVFYHGGQFSPAKRLFLEVVVSAMPKGCEFYHWGDIDYGGFSMLARLRREVYPGTRAWRMNELELKRYAGFTKRFNDSYGKRLESLLDVPELQDCVPCINAMLKQSKRLEQEAMLV